MKTTQIKNFGGKMEPLLEKINFGKFLKKLLTYTIL